LYRRFIPAIKVYVRCQKTATPQYYASSKMLRQFKASPTFPGTKAARHQGTYGVDTALDGQFAAFRLSD
jgi:hypothetical protein